MLVDKFLAKIRGMVDVATPLAYYFEQKDDYPVNGKLSKDEIKSRTAKTAIYNLPVIVMKNESWYGHIPRENLEYLVAAANTTPMLLNVLEAAFDVVCKPEDPKAMAKLNASIIPILMLEEKDLC